LLCGLKPEKHNVWKTEDAYKSTVKNNHKHPTYNHQTNINTTNHRENSSNEIIRRSEEEREQVLFVEAGN